MSLFWTQQVGDLLGLGGAESWSRSQRTLTHVTEVTVNEMTDTLRAVFRSGDVVQRGLLDLLFLSLNPASGGGAYRHGARRGTDLDGMEAVADTTPRSARPWSDSPSADAEYGWGPMPR
jgi:hypothetical protein